MLPNAKNEKKLTATGRLGRFFRRLFRVTRKSASLWTLPKVVHRPAGESPGLDSQKLSQMPSGVGKIRVTCVDYAPEQVLVQDVSDVVEFLRHHRPSWSAVRWINIDGITHPEVIRAFADKYQLHPLAVEDVMRPDHRPKAEDYPGHQDWPGRLFIIARMLELREGRLRGEQLSIFLGRTTVLTFQETPCEVFGPVRQRLQNATSRLRHNDASFLVYSLLDSLIDHLFPLLEYYSARLEEVEEELLDKPTQNTLQKIHAIKRELVLLRRAAWPMRDLIAVLIREKHECLSETTRTYFRDVYDHCVQIIDFMETYREIAGALTETYMSTMSNRLNEVMKVLTIMGTIFIPLTFLAGVYGMNMPIPENDLEEIKHYTYPIFWIVCLLVAGGMLLWFKRRGWI